MLWNPNTVTQSMLASQLTYHATLGRATAYRPEEWGHQQTSNYPIKWKEKQKTCWKLWVYQNSACYSCKQSVACLCTDSMLCSSPTLTLQKGKFWAHCLQSNASLPHLHWGIHRFASYAQINQKTHPQGLLLVFWGWGCCQTEHCSSISFMGSQETSCAQRVFSICEKLAWFKTGQLLLPQAKTPYHFMPIK